MKKSEFDGKHQGHTGDVMLFSVSELPKEAAKVKNKPVAYGETSGHCHILTGDVELFEMPNGDIYAAVGSDGAFSQHIHEALIKKGTYGLNKPLQKADHEPRQLAPNTIYKVGIHRRYDPFAEVMKNVID